MSPLLLPSPFPNLRLLPNLLLLPSLLLLPIRDLMHQIDPFFR